MKLTNIGSSGRNRADLSTDCNILGDLKRVSRLAKDGRLLVGPNYGQGYLGRDLGAEPAAVHRCHVDSDPVGRAGRHLRQAAECVAAGQEHLFHGRKNSRREMDEPGDQKMREIQ